MDFMLGFLKISVMAFVFVIVDIFSKYVVFINAPKSCPANIDTELSFRNVVKYF